MVAFSPAMTATAATVRRIVPAAGCGWPPSWQYPSSSSPTSRLTFSDNRLMPCHSNPDVCALFPSFFSFHFGLSDRQGSWCTIPFRSSPTSSSSYNWQHCITRYFRCRSSPQTWFITFLQMLIIKKGKHKLCLILLGGEMRKSASTRCRSHQK